MTRIITWGGLIAGVILVLGLPACSSEIGEDPTASGGAAGAPKAHDGGALDARGQGTGQSSPDAGRDAVTGSAADAKTDSVSPPWPDAAPPDAGTPPTSCSPPPRQLRLLTRREYRNTVRDLFQTAGTAPPCTAHTFSYDAGTRKPGKVHVSGTFNGWAKTVASGGWAMQLGAGGKVWTLQHDLTPGDYAYKFVLEESEWVTDPSNPRQGDDGQGGKNSLLTIACGGQGDGGAGVSLPSDLTTTFPAESRPRQDNLSDLFPFDDASEKQVASSTHIEEYWNAGKRIVDSIGGQLVLLIPCDFAANAAGCAEIFARKFGLHAFRRPLSGVEIERYKKLVTGAPSYGAGLAAMVRAFLSSPHFLYRSEGAQVAQGASGRMTPYETASALSYLLWGSMPDQALFDAAGAGQLDTPSGIDAEARRLLADPRSREAVGDFASQWLGAEEVITADKDLVLFPELTSDLRSAMVDETRRFFANVVFDSSHQYDELLRADYTFVNAPLASLYGIAGVSGGALRLQKYVDSSRSGLLGHAAMLGVYARSDQTSPIKRGLFVRRRLLCQDLPPPPANVPPVPAVDPTATTRERFRQHTSVPGCASCHQFIDGIGFGFEHFDAIGKFRQLDNGQPIDAAGDMNDIEGLHTNTSAPFGTLAELANVLSNSAAAKNCLATQYFRFSRGAFENDQSACALGQIQSRFRSSGYDLRELMIGVTQASDFILRR